VSALGIVQLKTEKRHEQAVTFSGPAAAGDTGDSGWKAIIRAFRML